MEIDDPLDLIALIAAAREMLAALWGRAMNNDLTDTEARAIQHGCLAIAIIDKGIDRVSPFDGWKDQ